MWKRPGVPDIVRFAEDHVGSGEAGGADIREHGAAAGTFETGVVPEPVESVQEEPLDDLAAASRAHFDLLLGVRRSVGLCRAARRPRIVIVIVGLRVIVVVIVDVMVVVVVMVV